MRDYVIITDSSCDLPHEMAEQMGIAVAPLTVLLDGMSYRNYLDGRELESKRFYQLVREGKSGTTSAVNVEEFTQMMESYLAKDMDVLYLGFSTGLSATYQAGAIAADDLREQYPNGKVITIDTLCASMGQGLIVYLAAREKAAGKTIEEVSDFVKETKMQIAQYFTVDDLHHLKRGGRISATAALLGSTLNIKPLLRVDEEGKLVPVGKVRGRKQSIKKLAEKFLELAVDPENASVFISHGDCLEDAQQLSQLIQEKTPVKEVVISYIGPVIGTHSGPGTVAMFFHGKHR